MTEDRVPTTEARWEEWARRLAPLIHDGLIDTPQERQIPDKAFYLARLLDEHLSEQPAPPLDVLYILGEATRRPITLDEYEVVRSALRASEQPAPPLDVERLRDEAHIRCLNDREEACRLLVGMLDAFDNRWTGEKPPPQIYYRAERFLNRMLPERLARND